MFKLLKKYKFKIFIFLIIYLLYTMFSSILIFSKPSKISDEYIEKSSNRDFYSKIKSVDQVKIIDDPNEAAITILNMIESAKEEISLAYYTYQDDESSNILYGALLDAANRGVKVRLLGDGMFNGISGNSKNIIHSFNNNPNTNIKFYKTYNPLIPWTGHNRLHDKIILIDNEFALISGRNIGDKYFDPPWYEGDVTNDRSTLVYNTDIKSIDSVIYSIRDYYNELWTSNLSKTPKKYPLKSRIKKAEIKESITLSNYYKFKEEYSHIYAGKSYLIKDMSETNKVTLIHNPINRSRKEPWTWYEIKKVISQAEEDLFIESPYIVPAGYIIQDISQLIDEKNITVSFFTNSSYSTPNLPGFSSYLNFRKKLVDLGIKIYETQNKNSNHAKAYIVDNNIAILGSFNLDPRSANINTESMIVINSKDIVDKYYNGMDEKFKTGLLVGKDYNYILENNIQENKPSNFKINLLRILSIVIRPFMKLI